MEGVYTPSEPNAPFIILGRKACPSMYKALSAHNFYNKTASPLADACIHNSHTSNISLVLLKHKHIPPMQRSQETVLQLKNLQLSQGKQYHPYDKYNQI